MLTAYSSILLLYPPPGSLQRLQQRLEDPAIVDKGVHKPGGLRVGRPHRPGMQQAPVDFLVATNSCQLLLQWADHPARYVIPSNVRQYRQQQQPTNTQQHTLQQR